MAHLFDLAGRVRLCFLLLASVCLSGSLLGQGLKYQPSPAGVVRLFEPSYAGLQQFFADSTLLKVSYSKFSREISLDSTRNFITVEESYYDTHYRLPITIDLEYYIRERLKYDARQVWLESLHKTKQISEAAGGGGIELNIPVKIKSKAFKRIFGGDRVGLRVTGNISFELAGRTEKREGAAVSSLEQQGNFAPKFKQTQQFRVEGRVGDKVTVSVDQNSEATFDFENTLKLTYEGDEDEIVQRIEAGNVALSLPATNYVSTSANHQGLFGLKTQMRVGNFGFTGIASLERGENQKLSITGGASEQTIRSKDIDYVRDRFFFADEIYRNAFEENIDTTQMILRVNSNFFIRQLDVWKKAPGNVPQSLTRKALAGINPDTLADDTDQIQGQIEGGRFQQLVEGVDYDFDYQRGYFWLKSQLQTNDIVGIAYKTDIDTVGQLFQDVTDTSAVLKLKLVRPSTPLPSYPTWNLTMRNVYNLGSPPVSAEGFDARIVYSVTGEDQDVDQLSGKTYNYLAGLDRLNDQGNIVDGGDRKLDLGQRFIFDMANGYLVFPSLTPFQPSGKFGFDPDRHVNIYNTNDRTLELQESKFEFEISTKTVKSSFDLGFNVLDGSERVTLNGRLLTRDKDYTIDYFSGQLIITDSGIRRADASVDIEYERGALFQLDKKTLLGGRLEYQFGERDFIGLTALYYSKSTLDQRIRLGQEPIRNFIWDVNAAFHLKPNFLTRLFDLLPIVETSAESNLKVEAEYAQVNPNPNTFNEEKIGDNDGVAYLDDFEGSKRFTSLGIQYRTWTPASAPMRFRRLPREGDPGIDYEVGVGAAAVKNYILTMDKYRIPLNNPAGTLSFNWYNPFEQIATQSIWPDRDVTAQSGNTTTVLNLRWRNDSLPADSAWAGIMRSTISFADQKKTKFIELWVRGNTGQINIDIGRISEDWYVKRKFPNPNVPGDSLESYANLNTEDKNFNTLLDDDEDVGIDGVAGGDGTNPDDAGDDDWVEPRSTQPSFLRINGTEGNGKAQGARFPDTEDLDGDGSLNRFNDYFEYSFSLDDTTSGSSYFVTQTYFSNGAPTGWKLYRIPIEDYAFKIGDPDTAFQQIFYVRLWMNNLKPSEENYDSLQIATFDFVGNEWEEEGVARDENSPFVPNEQVFGITVYNTDEHAGAPTFYTSPPGVEGIQDRVTRAVSKEQSLVMQLNKLPSGAIVQARKQFREKINLINYRKLKMFVHGNDFLHPENDHLEFYIRFGPTDKVYYEYRQRVFPGWAEENNLEIDFTELARTKEFPRPDSLNGNPVYSREDPNFPGKQFIVVGNPGLHNINYIVIGAVNRGRYPLDSEIWLDELRITGVERESGTAMRLLTDLSIADIATVRAQWELVDDNFRKLEQQFASTTGQDKTIERQSYFGSLRLNKFLPGFLGLDIPIDAKYTHTRDIPKYFYNSDQRSNYQLSNIEDRLKAFFGVSGAPVSQTPEGPKELKNKDFWETESRSIGGTVKRQDRPRDPWLLRLTVNQVSVDMDYSERDGHSPTDSIDFSKNFSGRLGYQIPFGRNNFISPFGWLRKSWFLRPLSNQKIYYTPSSFNFNFTISDSKTKRQNRLQLDPTETIAVNNTLKFALAYKLTESISLDFGRDYQNDPRLEQNNDPTGKLVGFEVDSTERDARSAFNNIVSKGDFGATTRLSQRFGANYTPQGFSWLTPSARYASNFIYSVDRPQINSLSSSLNLNYNFRVDFKLAVLMEKIYRPRPKTPATPPGRRGGTGGQKSPGTSEEGKPGEEKEKGGDKPLIPPFLNPLRIVWQALYSFKTISLDVKTDESYAHANLREVPFLQYQFGLNNKPQLEYDVYEKDQDGNVVLDSLGNPVPNLAYVDTSFQKVVVPRNSRITRGVDGTMQVDLFPSLKTSLKYNLQKTYSELNQQITATYSNTIFFTEDYPDTNQKSDLRNFIPDWRLNLSGVEKLPLLNLFARTASLEHSRNGKYTENERQGRIEQWGYSNSFQPLIGLTVNTIWGVTASIRANNSKSVDYRTAGATNRRIQSGINFSASYSVTKGFRIPLPLLNKKQLRNEIQFSLAFDKSSNENFSKDLNGVETPLDESGNWKLRPSITYRFSQKVNGTAYYEQSKSSTKRTGTTTYKEFGISVNISIR